MQNYPVGKEIIFHVKCQALAFFVLKMLSAFYFCCICHRVSQAKLLSVKLQLFSYPSVRTCVLGAHRDGSFDYPQHMFLLRNKNYNIQ